MKKILLLGIIQQAQNNSESPNTYLAKLTVIINAMLPLPAEPMTHRNGAKLVELGSK